jgi:hypothetical protein
VGATARKWLTATRPFNIMNRMSALTPWYSRLTALAELNGDRTQQDVARTLGVSKGAITSWKGGTRPDPEQVKTAARVYGADPLELLRIAYLDSDETAQKSKLKGRMKRPPRQG